MTTTDQSQTPRPGWRAVKPHEQQSDVKVLMKPRWTLWSDLSEMMWKPGVNGALKPVQHVNEWMSVQYFTECWPAWGAAVHSFGISPLSCLLFSNALDQMHDT